MSEEQEIEIEALAVEVDSQPVELYKVLKIANAVSGGGEAKFAISEGYVAVNGELETRKRCKLYDGDLVEFNQEFYVIVCDAPVSEPQPKAVKEAKAPKASEAKKAASKAAKPSKAKKAPKAAAKNKPAAAPAAKKAAKQESGPKDAATGRGSISF